MMSLTSSIPTDRRTTSGPAPAATCCSSELAVGGRGRVDHQRTRVADIGQMREHLEAFHELHASLIAALHAEGEDRAAALGRVALLQGMVLMLGGRHRKPRRPCRAWQMLATSSALSQWRCMRSASVSMPVRIRKALNGEMAGPKSRRPSTRQAMAKAKLPKVSCSTMPPYSSGGFGEHRVLAGFRPVEGAAVDDDAAHRVAVTADELGQRMDDDVGAVLDRLQQVGRRHGVVDDQRHTVLAGDLAMASMSTKVPPGLAKLSMKIALVRSSIWASKLRHVGGIGPADIPAEILEGLAELVDRAAVEPAGGDEVVARAHDGVEHQKLRGVARGDGQRRGAAFKRCDALFEHRLGRVHDAGVDVAEGLQAEQRGCVIGVIEDEAVVW
jgi:hypothetical protein